MNAPPVFTDPACARVDADLWFPVPGANPWSAKRICGLCVDRAACLGWALTSGERFGVWGGLTPAERAVEARRRRLPAPARAHSEDGPRRISAATRAVMAERARRLGGSTAKAAKRQAVA